MGLAFGWRTPEVTEELDVVDALANAPVTASNMGERSKPVGPPIIERVEISETSG